MTTYQFIGKGATIDAATADYDHKVTTARDKVGSFPDPTNREYLATGRSERTVSSTKSFEDATRKLQKQEPGKYEITSYEVKGVAELTPEQIAALRGTKKPTAAIDERAVSSLERLAKFS